MNNFLLAQESFPEEAENVSQSAAATETVGAREAAAAERQALADSIEWAGTSLIVASLILVAGGIICCRMMMMLEEKRKKNS